MGAYSYRALNQAGKTVKGVLEGDSERQIRSQLRSQQLKPIEVSSTSGVTKAANGGSSDRSWGRSKTRLGRSDLTLLTRQLASLVASGLPLDESLQTAARQNRKGNVKEVLLQVRSRVLEGLSLAQALGENPRTFNDMYRALVRAGESAGYLGPVLERLSDYTESSHHTSQRLRMAMIYPLVLLGVSVAVIGILMAVVVPKLTSIFEHSQRALPALTQILIATSDFVASYGLLSVLGIVAVISLFRVWLREPSRRRRWHRLLLRMPVTGPVILQADSARFAATLSLLISSGVPLLEALRIAGQVLTNMVLRDAAEKVAVSVQEGSSLHRALDQANIFPPLLVQMAASGEANGELDKQLDHAARNQERELEMMIGMTMGLLEPLTVLIMGGMVVSIVMAILLPIIDMNELF